MLAELWWHEMNRVRTKKIFLTEETPLEDMF